MTKGDASRIQSGNVSYLGLTLIFFFSFFIIISASPTYRIQTRPNPETTLALLRVRSRPQTEARILLLAKAAMEEMAVTVEELRRIEVEGLIFGD